MKGRLAKRIKTIFSLFFLFSFVLSSFPNFASAQNSGCTPNFSTKPMAAGGIAHTVVLKKDGTVWSWGDNHHGQLGDGSRNASSFPVKAQALCDVVAIAAGNDHTIALRSDGTLWAWGSNQYGQLGLGASGSKFIAELIPVQVSDLSQVVAVAAGSYHSVALGSDGSIWTWGDNYGGVLGYVTDPANGTEDYNPKPLPVSGLAGVIAISAGVASLNDPGHTVALRSDGTVWTWGSNRYAQLGHDANVFTSKPSHTPRQVPNLDNIGSIAAGISHTVALGDDGTVWAWGGGSQYYGELGNGTTANSRFPVKVLTVLNPGQELGGIVSIAASVEYSMALSGDGTVWAWGRNEKGQLGDGTFDDRRLLATKTILDGRVVFIAAGSSHSIALKDDGTVWTWGANFSHQLGYDTWLPEDPDYNRPSNVPKPVDGFNVNDTVSQPALKLMGKQRLFYPEWSTGSTSLTAYLNNPGSELANIKLELIPGTGLILVDGNSVHDIGNVASGTNAQTTWRVRPASEGIHHLTVHAYREGSSVPFATADYQIEALAPVVPPDVSLDGIFGYLADGTPTAGRSSTITIAVEGPCVSGAAITAADSNGRTYTGELSPTAGGDWSHPIHPSDSGLTGSPLTIAINGCGPGRSFNIVLIDPSGVIYNAERGDEQAWPLPGATVVLEYYDPALSAWVTMNEDAYSGRMAPISNPQTTGQDGRYGWDAAAGRYRVVVSRPGFQTAYSRVVDVPPPVTDLHVGLIPTDRIEPSLTVTGVTDDATYTQPVVIQFSASDDESGIRYVAYQLDGGEANKIIGANGSLPVNAPGLHTVRITAVDQAGNEQVKQIAFTIAQSSGPGSNADLSELLLRDVMLSPAFDSGTTSYWSNVANGVSSVTVTAPAYDAAYATVTASVYGNEGTLVSGPHILTGGAASPPLPLNIGSNTIKVTVTAQDGNSKIYTVTVTRQSNPSGPSGPSGPSRPSDGGTGSASPDKTRFRILIDGKEFEQIATAAASQEGGRTVFTIKVDAAQLAAQLAKAGNKPDVVLPVTASVDKVSAVLSGEAVKALENKQAVLEIRTPYGSCLLSAAEARIDSLSKQLGDVKLSDIVMQADIEKGDSAKVKLMENAAAKERFTVIVPPVGFTMTASFNGKKVSTAELPSYSYMERVIPLPDGSDPSGITTAVRLEADGTTRHAPTYTIARDGKYYAVIRSLTDGAYALIRHPVSFADVEGHWAKLAVNDMGSRMIVKGVDESRFKPDAAITRAEFAAIIVRAMGLADNEKAAVFTDVTPGDWYAGAIAKAQETGVIEGYEDQTFRSAKTITRQEGMAMIARAMKLAGLDTNVSEADADIALSSFPDGKAVRVWARQEVAAAVLGGLINGSAAGLLPNRDMTRAETAAIVGRMLNKAKLVGPMA